MESPGHWRGLKRPAGMSYSKGKAEANPARGEKVKLRTLATEGAGDSLADMAPLKRCPDTNRTLSAACQCGTQLRVNSPSVLPVMVTNRITPLLSSNTRPVPSEFTTAATRWPYDLGTPPWVGVWS